MNKLIELFDGSKYWHYYVVALICFMPAHIIAMFIDFVGIPILFAFWGGMTYMYYVNKTS